MKFRLLDEVEFRNFSIKHKYKNFMQTVETGLLREKSGYEKCFVGLIDKNKIVAATLLVSIKSFLGKKKFYAPRGFLIDYENKKILNTFTKEIKAFVKNNGGYYIKIDPYVMHKERDIDGNIVEGGINNEAIVKNLISLGYKHYGFDHKNDIAEQVRWMFVLDLENKTEDEIFSNFKQRCRTHINKTIKYQYEIKELNRNELDIFLKILEDTGKRKGFSSRNLQYFKNMYDIYSKNNMVKFLLISINLKKYIDILNTKLDEDNKRVKEINKNSESKKKSAKMKEIENNIADINQKLKEAKIYYKKYGEKIDLSSALFITYGDEIIYLSGGNVEEFLTFNGQYLSQWEMIKYGIKNNYKKYNFYGISGVFDEKHPQYGIYNFKRGFTGKVVELIGEFDLPVSNIYYIYIVMRKAKKVISNIFNCFKRRH